MPLATDRRVPALAGLVRVQRRLGAVAPIPAATSLVLVTTCLAAAAGGVGAMLAYSFVATKPDLSMALNGILAGLVGITAGADVMTPITARSSSA